MSEIRENPKPHEAIRNSKWFAVYTATHHEKSVCGWFTEQGVESFLPSYKASRQWKKRPRLTLDLPLFPNYVFVRIVQEQRSAVLGTPGVFSIVGSGQHSWELPEQEIAALRSGLENRKVEPYPYLGVGERAKVVSGPLAGLQGIIIRKKGSLKIVLSLDQIMKSVAIEVDAAEVEPVSNLRRPLIQATFPLPYHYEPAVQRVMS